MRLTPLLATILLCVPFYARAQNANPNPVPGAFWVYGGPTLGAGWSDQPGAFTDLSNTDLPSARLNLFPNPINGNCLVGNGDDWTSLACATAASGMNVNASNATLPTARTNMGNLPVINAKTDYGATGDGVTNDGPALATALAACNKNTPLYLPPGTYLTRTKNLTVPAGCRFYSQNGFTYAFNAPVGALIKADNSTGAFGVGDTILTTAANTSTIEKIAVEGILNVTDNFKLAAGGKLSQVQSRFGREGVLCQGAGVNVVEFSTLNNNGDVGFRGSCPDLIVTNNWIQSNTNGGIYYTGLKAQISGNVIEWNGFDNLFIDGRFTTVAGQVNITGNQFDHASRYNILSMGNVRNVAVTGNAFSRGGSAGASPSCHISYAGTIAGWQQYGNVFLASTQNDDGTGLTVPDYVYCADPAVTFSGSTIADNPISQHVGVFNVGAQALLPKSIDSTNLPTTTLGSSTLSIGGTTTTIAGLTLTGPVFSGTGASFTTAPLLNNNVAIQSKDSGGTARNVLLRAPDNRTYVEGGSSGLVLRTADTAFTIGSADGAGVMSWNQRNAFAAGLSFTGGTSPATGTGGELRWTGSATDLRSINWGTSAAQPLSLTGSALTMALGGGNASITGGGTLASLPAPVNGGDAVNKTYADSIASGIVTHAAAAAATTANLTATASGTGVGKTLTNSGALAAFAVDSYSASVNDRILVKDQTTQKDNGIYTVTTVGSGAVAWVLTRATDFDAASAAEVAAGASVIIINGTANGRSQWVETGQGPFTVDTTAIVFSAVTAASNGTVSAGTTNQLGYYAANGTTISGLTTANNGVLVTSAGGVPSISSTIPAATQTNITALGTIGTGVWQGTKVTKAFGGTDLDMTATGGANFVLQQGSAGGAITTAQLNYNQLTGVLPNPGASSLGGIQSFAAQPNKWINAISTAGVPAATQPACTDLVDAGTACAAATAVSGHGLPYLDGTNTWSGVQTFGTVMTNVNPQVGTTYTLLSTDCGKTVVITNASAITVTAPVLSVGCHIAVVQGGAGQITVVTSGGMTLRSAHGYTKTFAQYAGIGLSVVTATEWYLFGDGA